MKNDLPVQYRMTKQKRVILDILKSTKSHPTADWVYEKAKKRIPNISLGTVYRNLNILKEQGEIIELSYGKGYSRFDGNSTHHYHFTCIDCGKVMDADSPHMGGLGEEVGRRMGVQVRDHRVEFYGTCPECSPSDSRAAGTEAAESGN